MLAAACIAASPALGARSACGRTAYSYAGFLSVQRAGGVAATITATSAPRIRSGHVAGWVGFGGPRMGPNGADEWLQVGLAAFPGLANTLYYELRLPGEPRARWVDLKTDVEPGDRYHVAVLETDRTGWWQVWVDGKAVSDPLHLPGSHGWAPDVNVESWNGGRGACNSFSYGFSGVTLRRSGADLDWLFGRGRLIQSPGYVVVRRGRHAFEAGSAGFALPDGHWRAERHRPQQAQDIWVAQADASVRDTARD